MPVDLSPVDELDLDQELLDFAPEQYCANCTYLQLQKDDSGSANIPYCKIWDQKIQIESGMICPEYIPQGYE